MEGAKPASRSSRAELVVVAGTIVTMVLSCVCVVVLCAVANEASGTAAKVIYAAPSASAAGDVGPRTDVAGIAVVGLR
ncbi:MAG TPA: hypothetical protein VMT83_05060 [Burkholderiaceae bacterium]|nr:hypothetical protein [Burkholderiaceae bacterium]